MVMAHCYTKEPSSDISSPIWLPLLWLGFFLALVLGVSLEDAQNRRLAVLCVQTRDGIRNLFNLAGRDGASFQSKSYENPIDKEHPIRFQRLDDGFSLSLEGLSNETCSIFSSQDFGPRISSAVILPGETVAAWEFGRKTPFPLGLSGVCMPGLNTIVWHMMSQTVSSVGDLPHRNR